MDAGRPFHAHEVLEASWRAAPPGERALWQGLAQLAVGLTHAGRGNAAGAVTLLRRGAERVAGAGAAHGEVDAAEVAGAARRLADQIEARGLGSVTPAELRLRLRG